MAKTQHSDWVWGTGKLAIVTLIKSSDAADQSIDKLSLQLRAVLESYLSPISWKVDKVTIFEEPAQDITGKALQAE